jgi:hypothetical protein
MIAVTLCSWGMVLVDFGILGKYCVLTVVSVR